uniref:Uncharacterized protein LOC111125388 isoform X2 n=1 Tax=Crassostrea virginica TaxID=6565 RepID=A0A8B8D9T3_CRAVI|nr:uncharacterized protein LOC111125388 isoform X2 [Crassostrea virginica]
MWKKNKNNEFNRSASLPTRSKNRPPIFGPSTSEDDSGLSPEERDKRIHAALKQIKELAISAKEKYKKERNKHKQTGAYLMDCQTLIETSIPNLKRLLGISTHEEQRAREQSLAEEEKFRHNTNRDLRKWNSGFNEKKKHEDELHNLHNRYGKELENVQKKHESALRRLREMEKSVQSLEAEKENLLTRLSQVAGAKLRDNNPAISDLSDPNRPLKLIEKINELYDNEWTDAMEILETDTNEQMSIENLLKILQKCFGVCQHYAHHQLTTIRKAIELDEEFRPDTVLVGKCAKDMQKSISTWMLTDSSLLMYGIMFQIRLVKLQKNADHLLTNVCNIVG